MFIAVTNQSTLVSDEDVNLMCAAVQIQLYLHAAPAWNQKAPVVKFYKDLSKAPGYAWVISVLDNSDQAGVLGYHSEDNDKVDGFVFAKPVLDNGGVSLYDPNNASNFTVSSVLSHEILEMFGDRFANLWADGPTLPQGNQYALELSDPVESDQYVIDVNTGNKIVKVCVSNFVFPSYFNPEAKVPENLPFDYLNKLKAPFTMSPGGYLIVRSGDQVNQVFSKEMPDWKIVLKQSAFYRRVKEVVIDIETEIVKDVELVEKDFIKDLVLVENAVDNEMELAKEKTNNWINVVLDWFRKLFKIKL